MIYKAKEATMTTWRVLIFFGETKITYLVHIPTEEQQRGYHNDRIYRVHWSQAYDRELQLFTDAETPDDAKVKVKQLLLSYVEAS